MQLHLKAVKTSYEYYTKINVLVHPTIHPTKYHAAANEKAEQMTYQYMLYGYIRNAFEKYSNRIR